MRRMTMLFVALCMLAGTAQAQIGKQVAIRAGAPEDKALQEITATTDPAKKLALLDKFMADFGQGELALAAYEIYIAHYMEAKDYDKVLEYGEKTLTVDPNAFGTAIILMRAAQDKGDTAKMLNYAERIGGIVQRYKVSPVPEGQDPAAWDKKKTDTLADNADNITFAQYTFFNAAYQTKDANAKAALLERYVAAFPDSPYTSNAQTLVADAYQQAQNFPKMLDFAQKVLAREPENFSMLILVSDFWSDRGEQLDKAEEFATRALAALGKAPKPEQLTDEQWAQQKSIQTGVANSVLGQVHIHKGRNAQAVDALRAAAPLLKPNAFMFARNQYRLGFALLNLKRTPEARVALTDAASVDSPYRAMAQEKLKTLPAAPPAKKRP